MRQRFLSSNTYWILFSLLGIVYIIGLFVPLMDNDSGHHANIALRMYLTGDYVNLIDQGKDYLDKPHLLFWTSAAGYHLFGVTSLGYKFPSFLFTILAVYSTYRLGKTLYNTETGKLSALIVASAFAFILANNDVRMEAILTASIAFATWQLVEWVNQKRFLSILGAALGLALAFSTKGLIGVFVPAVGILFYILYKKDWRSLYNGQLLLIILFFFVFISPVLYCYYLQYDLHPEKMIRGKTGWSGVKFILWQQTFERYEGDSFGSVASKDYLFFFHSFLWTFAPWSILAYVAIFHRIKQFSSRKQEWLTTGTFAVMALMITFSGFKLPHYLNIIFPAVAVLLASFFAEMKEEKLGRFSLLQIIVCALCVLIALILNFWTFPVTSWLVISGAVVMVAISILLFSTLKTKLEKITMLSALTTVFIFYLLNANFYPQLLTYQGGNELAFVTRNKIDPKNIYVWPGVYTPSFQFYTKELKKDFNDSLLSTEGPLWVLIDKSSLHQISKKNLTIMQQFYCYDYNVSMLSFPFINPITRRQTLDNMYLVRVK